MSAASEKPESRHSRFAVGSRSVGCLTAVLRRIAAIAPGDTIAWMSCRRIAGSPPIPNVGCSSRKRNPDKPRPVVAGNGPLASPLLCPNGRAFGRRCNYGNVRLRAAAIRSDRCRAFACA